MGETGVLGAEAGRPVPLDGAAFSELVRAYHPALVRLAMRYVRDPAVAEDVAQETWLGVIVGLDRFGGRSSLKTWIFRILTNIAKTRAEREARAVPFGSFEDDPEGRFLNVSTSFREPFDHLLEQEVRLAVADVIATLPPMQRRVLSLRGLEGRSAEEVCELLGLSEGNQRVLLHRARTKVRAALG
jgi:RNA polymerase sigma-70 factor (ECF subfamily)